MVTLRLMVQMMGMVTLRLMVLMVGMVLLLSLKKSQKQKAKSQQIKAKSRRSRQCRIWEKT